MADTTSDLRSTNSFMNELSLFVVVTAAAPRPQPSAEIAGCIEKGAKWWQEDKSVLSTKCYVFTSTASQATE